ncbi:homeobox SEBOX-like [Sigmodon hispidus]
MELYPALEAQRVLATILNLKEEQIETWFAQHSLEQVMRPLITCLQSASHITSSCVSCCQPQSWWFKLIPINSSKSSTRCEPNCWFFHPEFLSHGGHSKVSNPVVYSQLHRTHQNAAD